VGVDTGALARGHSRTGFLVALAVPVVAWQLAVLIFRPAPYILPSPVEVLAALARQPGFFAWNGLVTVSEILLGFLCGASFGALVALAMAALPRFGRLAWPLLLVVQSFPVFVVAPLLVVWFGFGMGSKIIMASIIIFFPVASTFADGLARTDPEILDAVALTSATRWQTLRYIRLPLAMPALASGLRIAAPLAPLGAVVGEWVAPRPASASSWCRPMPACRPTRCSPPWRCSPRSACSCAASSTGSHRS